MNKQMPNFSQIIKELQAQKPDASVSILLPTAQMMPDKLQDRIRLKDLVEQAHKQLRAQEPERDFSKLIKRIHDLIENYSYDIESKGLALFANGSFGTMVRLPFAVKPELVIDKKFHITNLLHELARSNHYWVLEITRKMCRLYEAYGTALHEVVTPVADSHGNPVQGFPLDYVEPRDGIERAAGQGDTDSKHLDEQEKHYFMMVDAELGKKLNENPLPVVVCGVEKNLGFFRQITKHAAAIVGYQHGDFKNRLQIAQAVAPILEQHHKAATSKMLKDFVEAEGTLQQAFGMHRVWLMAREGRIDYLLVEENLVVPGIVDPENPDHLILQDRLMPEKQIGNLVDSLIGRVLETRGKIIFVPHGALKNFEHVGAILRY